MLNNVLLLAAEEVRSQIYIDDVLRGDNNFDVAKQKIEELWNFFQEASMMQVCIKCAKNFRVYS
jgi:hypothetical protein